MGYHGSQGPKPVPSHSADRCSLMVPDLTNHLPGRNGSCIGAVNSWKDMMWCESMRMNDPGWSRMIQSRASESSWVFLPPDSQFPHRAVWRLAWLQPLHLEHPQSQSESLIQLDCKTGEGASCPGNRWFTYSRTVVNGSLKESRHRASRTSTKQQPQLTRKPSIFVHQMEWMFGLIVPHLGQVGHDWTAHDGTNQSRLRCHFGHPVLAKCRLQCTGFLDRPCQSHPVM